MLRAHLHPSKTQAFVLGVVYAALLAFAFVVWNNLAWQICSGLWWVWAGMSTLYFVVWYRKVARDRSAAQHASYERADEAPRYGAAAPPTTPGSGEISLDWDQPPEG